MSFSKPDNPHPYRAFGEVATLGEGPLWHPVRGRLFWFDIPKGMLYSTNAEGGQPREWNFGEPASAAGWIDRDTLLVATASGLQKLDVTRGTWETMAQLEADNGLTRSNDGRTAPDGSFWIGTMDRKVEQELGAYYRFAHGKVATLVKPVSIPNATCFSPDGSTAYLADTRKQTIWRWELAADGAPIGEREVHLDFSGTDIFPDGAVCDAEGFLWNAQWDAWRVVRYAPDGSEDRIIELPVQRPTCPCFGGPELDRLFIICASEGLSAAELVEQPDAGKIIVIDGLGVRGQAEHQVRI